MRDHNSYLSYLFPLPIKSIQYTGSGRQDTYSPRSVWRPRAR